MGGVTVILLFFLNQYKYKYRKYSYTTSCLQEYVTLDMNGNFWNINGDDDPFLLIHYQVSTSVIEAELARKTQLTNNNKTKNNFALR